VNYEIIKDEEALRSYIDLLPDLEPGEQFYLTLLAREKYDPSGVVKTDKAQLRRVTATKDRIVEKIRQMEIAQGCYLTGGDGPRVPVPAESLALYMMPNPRGFRKANKKLAVELVRRLVDGSPGESFYNPKALALSMIQTSQARAKFVSFDFDKLGPDVHKRIIEIAPECMTIRTRGGYHALVPPLAAGKRDNQWYNKMLEHLVATNGEERAVKGDILSPVPGCCQGDFVPYVAYQGPRA
jgi:hypothetical protein